MIYPNVTFTIEISKLNLIALHLDMYKVKFKYPYRGVAEVTCAKISFGNPSVTLHFTKNITWDFATGLIDSIEKIADPLVLFCGLDQKTACVECAGTQCNQRITKFNFNPKTVNPDITV